MRSTTSNLYRHSVVQVHFWCNACLNVIGARVACAELPVGVLSDARERVGAACNQQKARVTASHCDLGNKFTSREPNNSAGERTLADADVNTVVDAKLAVLIRAPAHNVG